MKFDATIKLACAVLISSSTFRSTFGKANNHGSFVLFDSYACSETAVCATSVPSRILSVRSKGQCAVECQRQQGSCVGVNYRENGTVNTCELFTSNPTNYARNVASCQYMQIQNGINMLPECYLFDLQLWSLFQSISGADHVTAAARYNGQFYVTRLAVANVLVYDAVAFHQTRQITFSGLGSYLFGLATVSNTLFMSDASNDCVHVIDLSVTSSGVPVGVTTWSVTTGSAGPRGLSVTSIGNVLVVDKYQTVSEYTPSGLFVRRINDSNDLWHAIEVKNGLWAISRIGPVHGIAIVSTNGTVVKSFGSTAGAGVTQMNSPHGIAVDSSGNIIVADHDNNRILVLDPSLTTARQLTLPFNTSLQQPMVVGLGPSKSQLFVGEDSGQSRVMVFDSI